MPFILTPRFLFSVSYQIVTYPEIVGYPPLPGHSTHLRKGRGQPSTFKEETIKIWSENCKSFSLSLKSVKQRCSGASASQKVLLVLWKLEFTKYFTKF